ncbi:hypothetical protein DY000_02030622 [Brassica cretica]|uniref:Serine/threonine-protein phosphatase n=1 Tax=Brassica cretica TaxID=69181 RepID=A0ABQ7DH99_BRACR|nr:hypothetical protein DY000_02030622 [Brassica cretica]
MGGKRSEPETTQESGASGIHDQDVELSERQDGAEASQLEEEVEEVSLPSQESGEEPQVEQSPSPQPYSRVKPRDLTLEPTDRAVAQPNPGQAFLFLGPCGMVKSILYTHLVLQVVLVAELLLKHILSFQTQVLDTAAGVWCDTKSVVTSPRTGRYSTDAATNSSPGRSPGRYGFSDERTGEPPESAPGAVVLGSPVAPPVNGDMYTDISTENAMLPGTWRTSKGVDTTRKHAEIRRSHNNSVKIMSSGAYYRSWMDKPHLDPNTNLLTKEYVQGIGEFMRLVQQQPDAKSGFSRNYKVWYLHGETGYEYGSTSEPQPVSELQPDIRLEESRTDIDYGVGTEQMWEYLVEASAAEAEAISATLAAAKARQVNGEVEIPDRDRGAEATPSGNPSSSLIKPDCSVSTSVTPTGVRLHHRAVSQTNCGGALGGMVRQLSIDQFEKKGRGVGYGTPENATAARKLLDRQQSINSVPKKVVAHLLKPRGWKPPVQRQFFLDCNEIADLCDSAERIFSTEPTVLQLRAPIKIFGDLHGQFGDLMRLFDEYGSPSTAGDISYIDYLFLGDYVDRGQHSLETIILLLALKVEYQHNVHLIRGNHEAADLMPFLGERDGIWEWHRINRLFNWLPLAALIEKKIICMHGENWSDPTENDSVEGLRPNARGPGLVTFGPDRVMEFCNNNDLQLIVRAHECVMDGFERFAQGHLLTLFLAKNYCGKKKMILIRSHSSKFANLGTANNAGAILVLGRDLVVVPKLIHPLPPAITSPESSPERHIDGTWMQELNANRPPTPTRGRPQTPNDCGSLAWI